MNKKLIALLSILSLSLLLPLIPANAAVKAGASCKTLGITSVASGKTFTCIKSGKKLVWKLQPKGANPSPRSSTIASIETRYWSSPSHYELVNVNADLTRVFIIFEEKELRYQLTKWGMDSRLFVYAIAGGEQLLTVEPLKDVFQYAVNGKLLLSLWKKNVLDGALLKIAVGPLFMDKTIEFGSLIEAGALKPSLVPEKNWLLETRVDTSKITRTLGANPLPTQTPVPTQTQVYSVGARGPGGGVIFYVDLNGFRCGPDLISKCNYLESAPMAGTDAWIDTRFFWSQTEKKTGVPGNGRIGEGYYDSLALVKQYQTAGIKTYDLNQTLLFPAAVAARAYSGPNKLNDWYLPSIDELRELIKAYKIVGGKDLWNYEQYWSSTGYDDWTAWGKWGDLVNTYGKKGFGYVRPIRSF